MLLIQGDSLEVLKKLTDSSIDCVVTSPPYWGLRDYKVEGQLGLEPSFEEYIEKLCIVFDEVYRVLKPMGTLWVNIGDCYPSGGGKGVEQSMKRSNDTTPTGYPNSPEKARFRTKLGKCLLQIPARFAISMIDGGWILRNEIIWHKPNAMPESVKDRFTVDFEKVFFFVKNKKYYFEQQFEPQKDWGLRAGKLNPKGRNKRSVWSITTKPCKEAHFATFPEELIVPMIKAGCPENGVVLDPFAGTSTTGVVAKKLNRDFIGIELNPDYVNISRKKLMLWE